jgi:hypothetical protein
LLHARLSAFTFRLLLVDSRALFGQCRASLTAGRFLAVLLHNSITPLVQFALVLTNTRTITHARK